MPGVARPRIPSMKGTRERGPGLRGTRPMGGGKIDGAKSEMRSRIRFTILR